ncbi:hypothetical protein FGLOB1_5761 [Fusarium globosum]|uniref:Uncharacterized protein n=1 Tax=Fusarium globosum TaxID=78864 RepID=A0A8H5YD14_9HYPO|nr:hypothetical protein FGLOB1_5761 [Fusarium globosum]
MQSSPNAQKMEGRPELPSEITALCLELLAAQLKTCQQIPVPDKNTTVPHPHLEHLRKWISKFERLQSSKDEEEHKRNHKECIEELLDSIPLRVAQNTMETWRQRMRENSTQSNGIRVAANAADNVGGVTSQHDQTSNNFVMETQDSDVEVPVHSGGPAASGNRAIDLSSDARNT